MDPSSTDRYQPILKADVPHIKVYKLAETHSRGQEHHKDADIPLTVQLPDISEQLSDLRQIQGYCSPCFIVGVLAFDPDKFHDIAVQVLIFMEKTVEILNAVHLNAGRCFLVDGRSVRIRIGRIVFLRM